jgi:tetratricopeptide (TPR) repeat protein/lipopolysaccharide biosynthesis glycosyltransferase
MLWVGEERFGESRSQQCLWLKLALPNRGSFVSMQTPNSDKTTDIDSASPSPLELVRLGLSARDRGDLAEALRLLEAASSAAPEKLNILVEVANTLRVMARLDEADAIYTGVLGSNPNQFGALVGLGHLARQRGDRPGALAHFEAAARANPSNINIQVEVGNTLREMGRLDEADSIFGRVAEQEPENVGALLGLAYIARERWRWPSSLMYLEAAAAVRPSDPNIQSEIAHTLRALMRLDEAETICRRILSRLPEHVGSLVVLGSIFRQRHDYPAALAHLDTAAKINPSKLDVQVEVGNILRDMDRLDEAQAIYRSVLDRNPGQISALLGLAFVARQRGQWQIALSHFETAAAARPQDFALKLDVARTLCEMHRIEEAEETYLRALDCSPGNSAALFGLGRVARERSDWPAALAYFESAAAASPDILKIQLEIAATLRDLLHVQEAEEILRRLEENPTAKNDAEFQVRKLEHFCATLQLDKAADCLAAWGGHRNVPEQAVAVAASLYAARGGWQDVIDLFRERVVESRGIRKMADLLLEALARAARATGQYAEVLALLDRLPEAERGTNQAVANLRDQIIEEVRLRGSVDLLDGNQNPVKELNIEAPFRAWRADLLAQILRPLPQAKPERTVYLCTDRNYLPGAVVALSSLLRHNKEGLRNHAIRVYCADEILGFASAIFAELATAYSVRIDLRASTSLVSAGSGLRTGWGIFTPGHGLSEAAYYRIYAALQLLEEGIRGRALYVDSDTCVGPHLEQLFEFELQGQPVGARPELPTLVEIRRATLKLDLPLGTYFNSGVLLFDLSHPKLSAALRRAIDISLNQSDLLTFVDQCALNLAFRGMYATLPEPFNLYVRQDTEADTLAADPVVRHFLQRPKPWDPMYWSANSKPWFEEFAALAQILDPARLARLLALQFPDRTMGS